MKHPTDEEIEKFIRPLSMLPTPQTVAIVTEVIKWSRDQQPKLKMPEWIRGRNLVSKVPWGSYTIYDEVDGVTLQFHDWSKTGYKTKKCKSVDHGKQLAQADYERRINELYI